MPAALADQHRLALVAPFGWIAGLQLCPVRQLPGETHSDWAYQSSGAGSPYYGSYGTEGGYSSSGSISGYGSSGTHGRQNDQQGGQGQPMGGQIVGQAQSELGRCRKWPARSWAKLGRSSGRWPGAGGQMPYQMRERAGQVQQQAQGSGR